MLTSTSPCQAPHLIVAPLLTLQHWETVFTDWTNLNSIIYHGSIDDRKIIREREFAFKCDRPKSFRDMDIYLQACHSRLPPNVERSWMAQVIITTPELFLKDFRELKSLHYDVLVIDEAHRIKNHCSKFRNLLKDRRLRCKHNLLLTGTPIQNNMDELWSLLNIINPEKFKDREIFLDEFGNMKDKRAVEALHETIKPHMLRRLKEDVEKGIPPLEETIIEVELTILQKQCYRALYEKNISFFNFGDKRSGPKRQSMNNLSMQLRKCCNHPFLLSGVEDEFKARWSGVKDEMERLVESSGKFILLDKLLPKLKEDGHRVLIFSHFTSMLDIIEDYLELRGYSFDRIDGSIIGRSRQLAIDRFQNETIEEPFIMMLSTRAGGLGMG